METYSWPSMWSIYHHLRPKTYHFELNNGSWEKSDNPTLTDKELLILSLACRGFTTNDISNRINRSEATVKTHKNDILRKLKVNNMIEATHIASVFWIL